MKNLKQLERIAAAAHEFRVAFGLWKFYAMAEGKAKKLQQIQSGRKQAASKLRRARKALAQSVAP